MKKRFIPLLIVALLLTIAPAAMANHCKLCAIDSQGFSYCRTAVSLPGHTWCIADGETCQSSGVWCTPHGFAPELASEFTVVSVERLDEEPKPAANQTLVASLEAPATR